MVDKLLRPEDFNLGAAAGEVPISFHIGHLDRRVGIKVVASVGEMIAYMPPAQARELAASIAGMADFVERAEGDTGQVRRDAFAKVDTIRFVLPGGGVL